MQQYIYIHILWVLQDKHVTESIFHIYIYIYICEDRLMQCLYNSSSVSEVYGPCKGITHIYYYQAHTSIVAVTFVVCEWENAHTVTTVWKAPC